MNLNQKEAIKKGIEYLRTHDWCQVNLYEGEITKDPNDCNYCALGAIAMGNGFNPNMDTQGRSLEYHMYEFIKADLNLINVYQEIYSINDTLPNKDCVIKELEAMVNYE